eukprot:Nitzschia sp. Nitz4//scaffold25_size161228//100281//100793//NITZ4_002440-RA/size161228-processed-gene-0.52-mRNA-1//1//CDS//3329544616//2675//frame0
MKSVSSSSSNHDDLVPSTETGQEMEEPFAEGATTPTGSISEKRVSEQAIPTRTCEGASAIIDGAVSNDGMAAWNHQSNGGGLVLQMVSQQNDTDRHPVDCGGISFPPVAPATGTTKTVLDLLTEALQIAESDDQSLVMSEGDKASMDDLIEREMLRLSRLLVRNRALGRK